MSSTFFKWLFYFKSYWLSVNLYFIMVSLKFHCKLEKSDFLELEVISSDSLHIMIRENSDENKVISCIVLDKQTAIKLSKELRKQIALLD